METKVTPEDLKTKLNDASSSYQYLLHQTHEKALLQNELQTKRWQDYQKEHEELSCRLLSLRDQLSHRIMVPIGKRALMRGSLVHTNEILTCLGDGWFAKQSARQAADMCQRRIQHCDEMLKKLQKEEELLSSRKSFTFESEAFGGEQVQEIVEPYDEEAEKQWRERHRQKEKEYRQKLAELKKAENTKIETEEDLWQRLESLDQQEELEDELDRLNEDVENEEESDDDHNEAEADDEEDDDEEVDDGSHSESDQGSDTGQRDKLVEVGKMTTLRRKVSFKEDLDSEISENCDTSDDNLIRIVFTHSDIPPAAPLQSENQISSPSDIYTHYVRQRTPKSILKPYTPEVMERSEQVVRDEEIKQVPVEPAVKAVGDVVEHTAPTASVSASERPVSRFKAARLATKR